MQFQDLKLIDPLLRAVQAEGYEQPTPIQTQAIPHILTGQDLMGCAQTGTGKTAAFALPILQRLINQPRSGGMIRALVLSPTRELATQIGDSFATYGKFTSLNHLVIFGGVGQHPQVQALRRRPDIVVATPGRLLDLMNQGFIRLNQLEIFVLDEADQMLDMGFIHDVRRVIAALPTRRQTLMFSATMPQDIQDLADRILTKPVHVEVTPRATTVESIAQSVFFVEKKDKRALLQHILETDASIERVLVFSRTKHGANKLVTQLGAARIQAEAIHGSKSQSARERALANFKAGKTRVLVATDIAARGIDVENVTHVINYDLPNIPESYVHRIGRTARAGASGIAFSFCDSEERAYLKDIEKLIRISVPVVEDHPYVSIVPAGARYVPPATQSTQKSGRSQRHNGNRQDSRSGNRNSAPPQQRSARSSGGSTATSSASNAGSGPRRSKPKTEKTDRQRWN